MHECSRVFAPLVFIEIDSEEMAGVIRQQRVGANRVTALQVAINDRVSQ
jgi:hypothetical protein